MAIAPSLTSIVMQKQVSLTQDETDFVRYYAVEGMTASAAAKMAGLSAPEGNRLLQNPIVRTRIQEAFVENAQRLDVGRDDVLRGMKDAIDMASAQGDPTAMIRGWTEVGKITGLYNHTQQLNITTNAINAESNLKQLTTQQLADLISGKTQFADVLEGEFVALDAPK